MANATSSGRAIARNPYSPTVEDADAVEIWPVHSGLTDHPLPTPGVQVQILSVVDATGSATIGDIVENLSGNDDPVGAVFALITANVLWVETSGVIDANSIVSQTEGKDHPSGDVFIAPAKNPPAPIGGEPVPNDNNIPATYLISPLPGDLKIVPTCHLQPHIITGSGSQRADFGRAGCLQCPGVYVLLGGHGAYVGYGSNVGFRIAGGRQIPSGTPDSIIAITDVNHQLTETDGKALERILWARLAADPDLKLVNNVPDGFVIEAARYDELAMFAGRAALALRQEGFLFLGSTARQTIAGPRTEPGRLGQPRRINDLPEDRVMELSFHGLTALAAERRDGRWLLLRASDVRVETVASANCTASYQPAAWLHAGLLKVAADGSCHVVMRDLIFGSASAVSHFVSGSKGLGRAAWMPVDEDTGLAGLTL